MVTLADSVVRRIVILGGGFAGVYTARRLERLFARRDDVEITLVNRENYFVFQPLLAEVVSGNIGILDTVSPIRRLLKKSKVIIRDIDGVDLTNRTVTLGPGFWPRAHILPYDELVLALGSVTDFRGMVGLQEHALPFKNLADAIRLRNHVIHVLEEAAIEQDPERQRQLLTFVVAGGGFSGVEVAAELNDFLRRVARQFRSLRPSDVRVVIVHSGERVLERELGQDLAEYAQKILRVRGIDLILQNRLATATADAAVLKSGERIATKTIVSTVPSSPNPLLDGLDLPQERGKILVDATLAVKDHPGVWAVGDCALIPDPSGEGYCPPTAQHAVREAKLVAENIAARVSGKPPQPFGFRGLGKMGSLGHHRAVAELFGGIRISGFLAWTMWRFVYWSKLPGIDRKLKVGVSWLLDVLIPPEFVQLKVGNARGVAQAHYEPGDVVFRQGDLGDLLYIILEGEAEIWRRQDDQDRLVARLGPGDYFGEMALLNAHTRSATVKCSQSMRVLTLPKGDFSLLTGSLPELRHSFEKVVQRRSTP